MNAIIQAFLNQLALFALVAATYVIRFYQGKTERLCPFSDKVDLILFIIIWFGFGTYITWKYNLGIWAY